MPSNTIWKLFTSNDDAWLSILHDCAHAEKTIVLEQFIFSNDDFGQKLINICAERAKAGIKVRFLWDAAGSFTFWGTDIVADLKAKGIELVFWRTLIPSYFKMPSLRSWFVRDHRRTLVIDGAIGYTGSMCVADAMKNWRDTNVRLEGTLALEMENAFERMWSRAKHVKKLPLRILARDPEFRYITNYPAPGRRHLYKALLKALRAAKTRILITTPYFVPTHRLLRAVKAAAKRGVDVRLIIPEKSDHYPSLDLGARSFFSTMFEVGVRIFLYPNEHRDGWRIIHSKTVVVDESWAMIGSLNLDSVSLLYNFEAGIITTNHDFASELATHFQEDLLVCTEVSPREWKERFFLEKIPEIMIRLVRKFL